MQKRKPRVFFRVLTAVSAALTLALVAMYLGILPKTTLFDIARMHNYKPSPEIVALADNTTMNESTRRLFYVYHPDIAAKSDFNTHCRDNEQTIVLGCYVNYQGIYLLQISDARLKGVEEVTAAHETLHAAYNRLSAKERKKVDDMTAAAFAALTDQRVRDTIELYRKQDATVVPNELHSILGTEVRNLPADLETYYKKYFTDRAQVVSFSEQYEQVFTDQRNAIADYDAQLSSLKNQIDAVKAQLSALDAQLVSERSNLNSLKNSGRYAEYNAAVPSFNAKVNAYNKLVDDLTSLYSQFNDIVPKRNAVASEESELVKAIDSRDIPQQQ